MIKKTKIVNKLSVNKQNNLKAVFFDFGGTLMDNESDKIAHFHMMKAIKEHYQLPVTEEQLVNLYESQLFNHDMTIKGHSQSDYLQFKRLHFYSENAFKSLLEHFNIGISSSDIDRFNEIYLHNHLKYVQLVAGALDAISLVKENGYHCGVISDIDNDYQLRQFQALNLDGVFHSITTSEEVRSYKPDSDIFKIALEKANCQGNASLMIGDSYSKDIVGGKKMDMTTIWINHYQNNTDQAILADYIVEQFKEIIPIFKRIF